MKVFSVFIFLFLLGLNQDAFHWIESNLLACPFKSFTGIDCPGCGIQRSIIAIFQGNFFSSVKFYPATLPIFALLGLTAIHLKLELKNGALLIKSLYIGITLIIIFNYIYKIFTNQLI